MGRTRGRLTILTKIFLLKPRRNGILVPNHLKYILVLQRGKLLRRRKRRYSRGMINEKRRNVIALVNVTTATLMVIGRVVILCN